MTKIITLAGRAGVECPKEIGKMKKELSCKECPHYGKCLSTLFNAL